MKVSHIVIIIVAAFVIGGIVGGVVGFHARGSEIVKDVDEVIVPDQETVSKPTGIIGLNTKPGKPYYDIPTDTGIVRVDGLTLLKDVPYTKTEFRSSIFIFLDSTKVDIDMNVMVWGPAPADSIIVSPVSDTVYITEYITVAKKSPKLFDKSVGVFARGYEFSLSKYDIGIDWRTTLFGKVELTPELKYCHRDTTGRFEASFLVRLGF